MFKKFSNLKLLLILVLLIGIYGVVELTKDKSRSDSFRETLVEIDTAAISKIVIEGKGIASTLIKNDEGWIVEYDNKSADAMLGSVNAAINALLAIVPTRLVSKKESQWAPYEVDSAGTSVTVFEGDQTTLDLIIGKFNVQGQNSYSTYVRLADESETYSVKNFMPFSLSADPSNYRNNVLMRTSKDSIRSITFNYPDSAFALTRKNAVWYVNEAVADSAAVATYLGGLGIVSSRNFYDETENLVNPLATVEIKSTSQTVTVNAYRVGAEWVLNSSSNESSHFKDPSLSEKVMKSVSDF